MNAVVALGGAWAVELRGIAPRAKIAVIPNAIRPRSAVKQNVDGRVNVAFLGEIGDRKGTFTLIDAWAEMLEKSDRRCAARLTIAGDGEIDRAKKRVDELDLGTTVEVRGWMASPEVANLLAHTQVLVLPSRYEGQPMAILEAMARGLCVIASEVGGIPELLSDDCGVLIVPDNIHQLAKAILHVVENPGARTSLGRNALQRVRDRFDVEVVSRDFDRLYCEITS